MSELTPRRPDQITQAGNIRCRFDLFVTLLPHEMSRYPNRQRTWCHRGDKFTDDPEQMLCSLLRMFIKQHGRYQLAELYDNTRPKNDPERIVLRYFNGIIEQNRLTNYGQLLTKIVLPEYLKP